MGVGDVTLMGMIGAFLGWQPCLMIFFLAPFFGLLVGVLTILIRVSNPSYYEGVMFAILLASMFSPLIDFVVTEMNIRRRRLRLATDE